MAPRAAVRRRAPARDVPFQRTKYGRELLVDAAFLSDLPAFEATPRPHRLTFYDLLLVTDGRGAYELDGVGYPVAPGTLLLTRPGQVRRWDVGHLDGACLFFTEDFVREVFSDVRFLDQFACLGPDAPSAALRLSPRERAWFLKRFAGMASEIRALGADAPHLLRAILYEVLVTINRWYLARHEVRAARDLPESVRRFRAMLERDITRCHRLGDYAGRVGLTPGHLNALCRWHVGRTAGQLIRQRLALEARRRLLQSDSPVFVVSAELGFRDPAYFTRFFRRETGLTPRRFRQPARGR
jgi:AraC-like DNA-binding protein